MWCERLSEGSKGFKALDINPFLPTTHSFLVLLYFLGTSNIYAKNMTFLIAGHNLFSYS